MTLIRKCTPRRRGRVAEEEDEVVRREAGGDRVAIEAEDAARREGAIEAVEAIEAGAASEAEIGTETEAAVADVALHQEASEVATVRIGADLAIEGEVATAEEVAIEGEAETAVAVEAEAEVATEGAGRAEAEVASLREVATEEATGVQRGSGPLEPSRESAYLNCMQSWQYIPIRLQMLLLPSENADDDMSASVAKAKHFLTLALGSVAYHSVVKLILARSTASSEYHQGKRNLPGSPRHGQIGRNQISKLVFDCTQVGQMLMPKNKGSPTGAFSVCCSTMFRRRLAFNSRPGHA